MDRRTDLNECGQQVYNPRGFAGNMNRFEEKTDKQRSTSGCNRVLLGLVILFVLTTIVAVCLLMWKIHSKTSTPITRENLLKAYPGRFRSLEEQAEIERLSGNLVPVTNVTSIQMDCYMFCDVPKTSIKHTTPNNVNYTSATGIHTNTAGSTHTNTAGAFIRRKRATPQTSFHGCCVSQTFFTSPATLQNLQGQTRILVVQDDAQQFFQTASCATIEGCQGCTCMLDQQIDTAVVYKDGETEESAEDIDDTEIDAFYFFKCCKCFNVGLN